MGKWLACYLRVKLVKFMFRGCYYSLVGVKQETIYKCETKWFRIIQNFTLLNWV